MHILHGAVFPIILYGKIIPFRFLCTFLQILTRRSRTTCGATYPDVIFSFGTNHLLYSCTFCMGQFSLSFCTDKLFFFDFCAHSFRFSLAGRELRAVPRISMLYSVLERIICFTHAHLAWGSFPYHFVWQNYSFSISVHIPSDSHSPVENYVRCNVSRCYIQFGTNRLLYSCTSCMGQFSLA